MPPGTGLLSPLDHRDLDPDCESSDSERLKEKRKELRGTPRRHFLRGFGHSLKVARAARRRNADEETPAGEDFRGMITARHPQKRALLLRGGVVEAVESIPFVYFILTRR